MRLVRAGEEVAEPGAAYLRIALLVSAHLERGEGSPALHPVVVSHPAGVADELDDHDR
ncbi:hypothetical protein [Nocardioides insulae]|uniref:hypothetical protein n=1 Tax=Nocardioides insulae TaxID=394734 RepID=UPI00146B1E16|nr:hypothetical protein [Nocardioides insulae]